MPSTAAVAAVLQELCVTLRERHFGSDLHGKQRSPADASVRGTVTKESDRQTEDVTVLQQLLLRESESLCVCLRVWLSE